MHVEFVSKLLQDGGWRLGGGAQCGMAGHLWISWTRGWGAEERSEEGLRCCQAGQRKKSNREGLIPSLPLGGAWLHGPGHQLGETGKNRALRFSAILALSKRGWVSPGPHLTTLGNHCVLSRRALAFKITACQPLYDHCLLIIIIFGDKNSYFIHR